MCGADKRDNDEPRLCWLIQTETQFILEKLVMVISQELDTTVKAVGQKMRSGTPLLSSVCTVSVRKIRQLRVGQFKETLTGLTDYNARGTMGARAITSGYL